MSAPESILHFILFAWIVFAVATFCAALLWRFRNRLPHAVPNHRTLHDVDIPRVGGISIWSGFLFGVAAVAFSLGEKSGFFHHYWGAVLVGLMLLAAISLKDDFRHVPPIYRLMCQFIAAVLITASLSATEETLARPMFEVFDLFFVPRVVALFAIVFFIVWMVNLFNFMDGADGLLIAMTVIGFSTLAVAARHAGFLWWWLPAFAVIATLPIGIINLPPAKMFLGDVGAIPLGFLAAGVGGFGIVQDGWSLWFVILTFLPFILDASLTLLKRLIARERVWEAHNKHYFQRLIRLGFGHRAVFLIFVTLMLGCATAALLTIYTPLPMKWALLFWLAVHAVLFIVIEIQWAKENADARK